MRPDLIMLADAATAAEGKLFIHGGGVTRLMPPVLPWAQPQLVLVARFLLEPNDYGHEYQLRVSVTDPNGAALMPPADVPVSPQRPAAHIEGEEQYMNLALGMANLTFAQAGPYRFELWVDGDLVRALPLVVVGAPPDEQGRIVMGGGSAESAEEG